MQLKCDVLSCTERSGTNKFGKPYKFFVVNMVVTASDGKRAAGEVITEGEVKPGNYTCGVTFEAKQGRIEPRFGSFAVAKA